MDESSSGTSSSSSTTGSSSSSGSTVPISAVLLAGLELGTWNFLATAAQACGLNLSTATKAAFLTQTTAVFTPCLAMLCGMAVLPVHWVACLAALLGSYCITLDSMGGLPETSSTAALVSSMERQQQELSATVQQQQPPGLVTEALEAPPVLAATDAGAGVSSAAGQQVELPLTVAAPAATAAADSRQYAPSTADAAALEEAFDSAFASSDALTEQQASGAEQQGDTAAAGQLPQLTPAQGQTQPLASSATGSQVSTSGVADAAAAAGGVRAGAGNTQYSSSDSAGTAGSLQFAGQLADNQEAAEPASSIAAGGVPTEQFQQQGDLGQDVQQEEQQPQELSPAQLMVGNDVQADTSSTSTGVAAAKVGSSWGMTGEAYILLACCCYAIATVRLSMLAPGLDPVQLATSKTLTLAAASMVWLLAFGPGPEAAAEGGPAAAATSAAASTGAAAAAAGGVLEQAAAAVQSAWASWQLPPAFETGNGKLLLFYSALGPGALATVLQTKGQGTVGAAQAQVFYSLTPIWAALLATLCLQGEEMGPLAWLGGCIIIAASIGAAISGSTGSGSSSGGASDSTP
jgi:drug/metabolite transporter (DMT)-like permease